MLRKRSKGREGGGRRRKENPLRFKTGHERNIMIEDFSRGHLSNAAQKENKKRADSQEGTLASFDGQGNPKRSRNCKGGLA